MGFYHTYKGIAKKIRFYFQSNSIYVVTVHIEEETRYELSVVVCL